MLYHFTICLWALSLFWIIQEPINICVIFAATKVCKFKSKYCSGSEGDTDLESVSNYEPSDGTNDSDSDCYDPSYSNSTHQAEYTDIPDYEDAVTSSEDEILAGTFAVKTVFHQHLRH